MQVNFIEGFVKYPDDLPCPQADTDLVPRERRYTSDISDVRSMRMFQQEFQATRNRITFIFTEEEVRQFREWYEVEIIFGGAWFYADWPTLHKDKKIAHRFVGQPKYEWLFGGNPGMMGRSSAGVKYAQAPMAVPMYKVTATVELYERKVGKTANVFTSKLYPVITEDHLSLGLPRARGIPSYKWTEEMAIELPRFTAVMTSPNKDIYVDDLRIHGSLIHAYLDPSFTEDGLWDEHVSSQSTTLTGKIIQYNYRRTDVLDNLRIDLPTFTGEFPRKRIQYDYYTDDGLNITLPVISEGELR